MTSKLVKVLMTCSAMLLAQCNASLIKPADYAFGKSYDRTVVDPSFEAGIEILKGFDEPASESHWSGDDWMLLGIKVAHDNTDDVWFVRVRTLPPERDPDGNALANPIRKYSVPFTAGSVKQGTTFSLPTAKIRLDLYDRTGDYLQTSIRYIPMEIPTASVYDTCKMLVAQATASGGGSLRNGSKARGTISASQAKASGDGLVTLMTTLRTLGYARALKPVRDSIREHVVKEPPILGLLLNGLRLTMNVDFTGGEVQESRWSADAALAPRYKVQSPVILAGQQLFDCMVVACAPQPPYHLTSGVLLFEAAHPEKPQNRLTIQVLAAKRYAGPEDEALVSR